MSGYSRRDFLCTASRQATALSGVVAGGWLASSFVNAQELGDRPPQQNTVKVLNPRVRVPVSLLIDDSTCLVNLAHFGMPQFAQTWPERESYQKPWKAWPREIPDSFVRKFGEWCAEGGIKGKYSIVPYPACVGWLDRYLPGWSHVELQESIKLVQDLIVPNWDIHPEMVSHTRVVNTRTGRPYEKCSEYYMENWRWTDGKSVDELADYMSYALRILKNVDLPCEGITTPGGFGNRVLPELSQATLQACRDVYGAEIPHYFRHLYTDDRSVAPRIEYAAGLDSSDPQCVVSIIGCTGDWFGGWDGDTPGEADQFITADLSQGRVVDVVEREEPAIMVCHWPGMYFNGQEHGFHVFQETVRRLHRRFDHLLWMKTSEIARYWAAKELTSLVVREGAIEVAAPFAASDFTVQTTTTATRDVKLAANGTTETLRRVGRISDLQAGTWHQDNCITTVCFDLQKGRMQLWLGDPGEPSSERL